MKGTRKQFEAIAALSKDSYGYNIEIEPSDFEGVVKVTIEHDDQRDGKWVDVYLIGEDGDKVKIKK